MRTSRRKRKSLNVFYEYIISVGSSPLDFIIQEHVYSHNKGLNRAHKLSLLYPQYDITIEEWKFISSDELFVSGLYKGNTTTLRATQKEVYVA